MKPRHILILGIIMALLSIGLVAKSFVMKPKIEEAEYKSLDLSIDPNSISSIKIKKLGQEILNLEKKDSVWYLPSKWNIRGNIEKIMSLLNGLSALQGELRSSSESLFSDYGIQDSDGISMVMSDKDGVVKNNFVIGVIRPATAGAFLRAADSKEVYLVNKDILSLIGIEGEPKEGAIDPNKWMDLAIAQFNLDNVTSLKVVKLQDNLELTKLDIKREFDQEKNLKKWVSLGGEPIFDIDAKKIKDKLKEISELKASEALGITDQDYGFQKPYLKVNLLDNDKQVELIIGDKYGETEDRYLKNADGLVYIIRRYAVTSLDIDISKFFIDNPLKVNKEKIDSITVKAKTKNISLNRELIGRNSGYLDKIKRFSVERLISDKKYTDILNLATDYFIEIKNNDGTFVELDAALIEDIVIAKLKDKDGCFEIKKSIFINIFEELDALDLKTEENKVEKDK